jgi:predicted RNA-binding Zn ribbon-like protein
MAPDIWQMPTRMAVCGIRSCARMHARRERAHQHVSG